MLAHQIAYGIEGHNFLEERSNGPGESQVLIEGLSFDRASSQVIDQDDGRATPCATVKITQGIFGRRVKVRNTGLCTLSSEVTDLQTDDGFLIRHRTVLTVYFNVQN